MQARERVSEPQGGEHPPFLDLLDRMMSGVSDMVWPQRACLPIREVPGHGGRGSFRTRLRPASPRCATRSPRTRMQRIDNLFVSLPRMVRDLAAELGKQVVLEMDGGDVELDREMIEMIRDP
jgi:two-component system chemotaxis sensor kinase CheA